VYCSPIEDSVAGLVGFDVVVLESDSLQEIAESGDASKISIMFLLVSEQGREILFSPNDEPSLPSRQSMQAHFVEGSALPGYITLSRPLSNSRWTVHAVVNEKMFFAEIRDQRIVLFGAVLGVMLLIFLLTVLTLRPIIRALLKEAELIDRSERDSLTGLHNHAYVEKHLDIELARARRGAGNLAVVMFDLDHFKNVNDNYGHQAGDQVLRSIATLAQRGSRVGDIVSRYGGEEFMLVLPDTDLDGARIFAERFRATVASQAIRTAAGKISVTVSIGISGCMARDCDNIDAQSLVSAADEALYASKHAGRNQITLAALNQVTS